MTTLFSKQSAYMTALMAAIAADGLVDDGELLQMYELFALFETDTDERRGLIEALWMDPEVFQSADIPAELRADTDLSAALAKDLLLIESNSGKNKAREIAAKLRDQFSLGAEQLNVLTKFVAIENRLLRALGAPDSWIADEQGHKELVSRAAAVGIPLTALNVAGIGGFGAAGITSGLAALGGMSGLVVLGLNPMTAGIGALILSGVAVKKISDYALSTLSDDSANDTGLKEIWSLKLRSVSYIAADAAVVGRPRNREILRPVRRERRSKLSAALTRVLAVATSS